MTEQVKPKAPGLPRKEYTLKKPLKHRGALLAAGEKVKLTDVQARQVEAKGVI